MEKKLMECTYANTPNFNFDNKIFTAKCVKVYDGDTITAAFVVFGEYYKFNIRMNGYDSPEIKTKDPTEKKWAKVARDLLADTVLDKIVTLTCKDYDKYGRILGEIEIDGINVNQMMIDSGYCRVYAGGHKNEWDFSQFAEPK